jgi:hypothetical protein
MQTNSLILWTWLISSLCCYAQDSTLIPEPVSSMQIIGIDNMENIYAISSNHNELHKFDVSSEESYAYSNTKFGKIHSVDISNPLQIMVYYKDFNISLLLDRFLSEIGNPTHLENLGHYNGNLVCQSVRGGFWVYDPILFRVFYYDKAEINKHKTPIISSLIQVNLGTASMLLEHESYLLLSFPEKGVLVFDLLGNFHKIIFHQNADMISLKDQTLFIGNNEKITAYNLLTLESNDVYEDLPDDINQFILMKNKLYIFRDNYFETVNLKH